MNLSLNYANSYDEKKVVPYENSYIKIDFSFNNVKRILDSSMISNGLRYYNHQEISTPDNRFNTISFVYIKNNRDTLPSIKEIETLSIKAEGLKFKGNSLMQLAQEKGDNEMAQEAASMLVEADRLVSQEDRFYTIEIGKDMNTPPIVMVQVGLPEWIIMKTKALALAEAHFGEQANTLNVERTTLGAKCIYIAINSKGDSIYIDTHSGNVFTKRFIKAPKQFIIQNNSQKEKERFERIKSQWQEFMRYGINVKDFSLDELTDLSKQTKK
jgi:hypothetical protein